ncbi:MAG: hypothetical protein EB141_00235 [Verrucomicrobia bacterium]|nr:hypothetical protein [Pseudomonadota bacterium]NDA65127.1 hypothetical protein [Verrucomicrobiota bacterium]NBV22523.1 hypothetical protein [Pseudomonadota bacterium]NDB74073.1 hypothetical protein [Verrucomicrobiota bacterium]NDD37005.1 hypothetical protein [Verrucomicrobiota bacterium]
MIASIALVAIIASFGTVLWWKHAESKLIAETLESYERLARESLATTKELSEKVQRPWGDVPPEAVATDQITELDTAWIQSPESIVPFDDDLAVLGDDLEEL